MNPFLLALVLLPLVVMVVGFLVALRPLLRANSVEGRVRTAGGRPVLRFAPRASLRAAEGEAALPGPGTLLLTDREVVFERFVPRREFRVGLERLVEARASEAGTRRGDLTIRWNHVRRLIVRLPDAEGWAEAIRDARSCYAPCAANGPRSPRVEDRS